MGMFDRVLFQCPNGCEDPVEVQSKAGACTLTSIPARRVPWDIATDIVGDYVYCETCKTSFIVRRKMEESLTVPLELYDAP